MDYGIQLVRPRFEIWTPRDELVNSVKMIERAGRKSHLSEEGDAEEFVAKVLGWGHESIIEHRIVTVLIVCDRACSHQLVRHRLAAYTQESQRYCNYSKGKFDGKMRFIIPWEMWDIEDDWGAGLLAEFRDGVVESIDVEWVGDNIRLIAYGAGMARDWEYEIDPLDGAAFRVWAEGVTDDYDRYLRLLWMKKKPEDARSNLPNASKTEVVSTFNLREWRHVFNMRCSKHAQWQIRDIMTGILGSLNREIPVIFEDQAEKFLPEAAF